MELLLIWLLSADQGKAADSHKPNWFIHADNVHPQTKKE